MCRESLSDQVLYGLLAILFIYDTSLFVTTAMAPDGKVGRISRNPYSKPCDRLPPYTQNPRKLCGLVIQNIISYV